ncbi:MAG: LUD domain-containing protein [Nitrososphaeria archaeon]
MKVDSKIGILRSEDWKVQGYELNLNESIKKFREVFTLHGGHFYYLNPDEARELLVKLILGYSSAMYVHLDSRTESLMKGLAVKRMVNLEERAGDPGLKNDIKTIEVGIGKADALAAESGALIFYDYDALKSYVAFLPEINITFASEDDLFPTVFDAFKKFWSSAEVMPASIQIVQSPSRTGDIEYKIVRPSHGPRELYAVLLKGDGP